LYVADSFANRVLEYSAPLSSGMAASLVFGQGGSFTNHLVNNGGVSRNSLNGPMGLALDARGNLYVADTNNSRVLEYDAPLSQGTAADRVFGQPNFISSTGNTGGLNASGLGNPNGVALDAAGNLYVADTFNNRVLEYDAPLSQDAAADRVFGQPGPTTGAANNPALNGAGLNTPVAVAVDPAGNLFVADKANYRLLEYDAPLTTNRVADRVWGQPDLFHNVANNGGVSDHSLTEVLGVALDAHGDLFVSDGDNNRVLEFDRPLPLIDLFLPLTRR
jgi:sugar lactone lactonase YvrE